MIENELLLIPIVTGTLRVFSMAVLYKLITREKAGTPDMRRIAGYIQEGAQAFIKREVKTIAYFIAALVAVLFLLLGWEISVGFALGACLSVLAMVIGIKAVVTGDVFGDPLKDTTGPALHILIKLLNIVSITLLPVLITLNL
jgi:K(+)-stimulated pyrophosphate-energized sodium pump